MQIDDAYNFTDCMYAISEVGMNILCVEDIGRNVIRWIARTEHTFPKTRKGWISLLGTQFKNYYPSENARKLFTALPAYKWGYSSPFNDRLWIKADPESVIEWLITQRVLSWSTYGTRLNADVFHVRAT